MQARGMAQGQDTRGGLIAPRIAGDQLHLAPLHVPRRSRRGAEAGDLRQPS